MKKVLATIVISLAALLFFNTNTGYADLKNINFNRLIHVDDFQVFASSHSEGEGKDKFQLRIKEDEFSMKGIIEASTSNTLTINGNVIYIDSSVTGDTKVVGDIEIGMYAHVKGVIENSTYNASQVVIDQRFKQEVEDENEEEDEDENESPTPTLTATPTPIATESANIEINEETKLDLSALITRLQEILNFLTSFVSSI